MHSPSRSLVTRLALASLLVTSIASASSHREAPFITENPKIDGTDFYLFRSYEAGREGFVTLVANYVPLQDAYGGPNYFALDPDALYRIHIDNSGDGIEDLTFQFRVSNTLTDIAVPAGGQNVSIPLINAGAIGVTQGTGALNVRESYSVQIIRGSLDDPRRTVGQIREARSGSALFGKPVDNIGEKSLPDYDSYARSFISEVAIPGCGNGRVFVGQRKESFAVNLGETFDLVNIANPLGPEDAEASSTADKNVTSFILEAPIACLTGGNATIIGGWTTAALRRNRTLRTDPTFQAPTFERAGDFVQVSRLGMPLVNEVVIGLKDKDRFNASRPAQDSQFATYVTNPTLPELLEILFGGAGVRAPNNFPRQDLLAAFVTGIDGLNKFGFGEMQRLNVTIPPTAAADQNRLGVIGGDNAGFPNGRRPGDDVVDIELRVAMGLLCHAFPGAFCNPADAPSGTLPFTDGTWQHPSQFDAAFPYLKTPLAGSGNAPRVFVATLGGGEEVPPVATTANGACTGLLDANASALSLSCTHTVAGAVAAHIHLGAAGTEGGVICDLGPGPSPILATCPLSAAQLSALRQEGLYVNVHSGAFPGGEIRGQLQ
jgi:hypothetical protein